MSVYKNEKDPAVFIMCDCQGHALHIERYVWDDSDPKSPAWFDISIWDRSPATIPFSFRERLRWCWWILRKGRPWADYCIMNEEKAKKISEFIQSQLTPPTQ